MIEIVDAKGHVTDLAWDGRGRLVRETRHVGASSATWESTLFRYGAPNFAASGTPNLGNDPPLDVNTPGENLLQVEVGALGVTGTTTPGRVQRFVFDARGNMLTVQRKDGASYVVRSHHHYDSDDNRVKSSEPTGAGDRDIVFAYDAMQRLRSVQDAASNVTQFEYDAVGNRTKVIEAVPAQFSVFVYDDLDRLIEVQASHGADPDETTKFRYDAVGNVTRVTDPKLQETDYAYDALSRLESVEQHLGQTTGYRYDDRGRLTRVVNARGHAMNHVYELWGGIKEVRHYPTEADAIAGTNLSRTVAYGYDLEDNLTSASDNDLALGVSGLLFSADFTTGYDERNRLHEHTVHYVPGGDLALTSTYNRFGERSQLDLTQGSETLTHSWTYDAQGRLDTATFPGSGAIDFTPRPDDFLQTIARASGVATNYAYFAQGPVDTINVTAPVIGQQSRLDYVPLNPVQNITGLAEQYRSSDPTYGYSYGYDGGNRLTSADYPAAYGLPADDSFTYDPAGNREISGSLGLYDYDGNNRITVSPSFASYGFDADGNLTSRTGETFAFDDTNRVRTFTKSGTSAAYAYDPFGRRIKKTVNGTTVWTIWDGDQRLAEYDNSGDRTARYAYAEQRGRL